MKLFVVALLVAAGSAARLENTYLPPGSAQGAGANNFLAPPFKQAPIAPSGVNFVGIAPAAHSAPAGIYGVPAVKLSPEAHVQTLRFDNNNNGDGNYAYAVETQNGINFNEAGQLKNAGTNQESTAVHGSYSYIGADGATYNVEYVADENGFQPIGQHLPTAPPVPEEILKALQQNAADEAAGISDDGQYRPQEHESIAPVNRQYLAPQAPNSGYRY